MIDLTQFYWAGEAAKVISKKNNRLVTPDYVRKLTVRGVLTPVNVNGRNLYPKHEVENVVVERRGAKRSQSGQSA